VEQVSKGKSGTPVLKSNEKRATPFHLRTYIRLEEEYKEEIFDRDVRGRKSIMRQGPREKPPRDEHQFDLTQPARGRKNTKPIVGNVISIKRKTPCESRITTSRKEEKDDRLRGWVGSSKR